MEKRLAKTIENNKRYNLRRRGNNGAETSTEEPKHTPATLGTSLLRAASEGNRESMLLLLSNGADVNFKGRNGKTPLLAAIENDDLGPVDLLLRWDCDVNAATKSKKETPLHVAAANGNKKLVELLLEFDADTNLQNSKGETALIMAARENRTDIMKLLINKDCDLNCYGKKALTALYWAADQGDNHMVQLLLGTGADPNLPTDVTQRPLVRALQNGNRSIAKLLLSCGAEAGFRTTDGQTMSQIAKEHGLVELSDELHKMNKEKS